MVRYSLHIFLKRFDRNVPDAIFFRYWVWSWRAAQNLGLWTSPCLCTMSMEYLLAEAWAWDIDSMYVRICYSGIPRDFCMWVILFFKQKYFCPTLILWSMRLKLKNLTSRIILFVKLECTCGIYIFQSYQTKCFCDDSQSAHHESEGCLQENNRQLVGQPKEMRV